MHFDEHSKDLVFRALRSCYEMKHGNECHPEVLRHKAFMFCVVSISLILLSSALLPYLVHVVLIALFVVLTIAFLASEAPEDRPSRKEVEAEAEVVAEAMKGLKKEQAVIVCWLLGAVIDKRENLVQYYLDKIDFPLLQGWPMLERIRAAFKKPQGRTIRSDRR